MNDRKKAEDIKFLEGAGFTLLKNDDDFTTLYKAVDIFKGSGLMLIFYVELLGEMNYVEFKIARGGDELKEWLEDTGVIPNTQVKMPAECPIKQLVSEAMDLAIEKLVENILQMPFAQK